MNAILALPSESPAPVLAPVASSFLARPAANEDRVRGVPAFRLRTYLPTAYRTCRQRPLQGAYLP